MQVCSILSSRFADSFGFTEKEVKELLAYYELGDKYEKLQRWYDGYRFGDAEIYNPWSILNYVDDTGINNGASPKPYWANTSSNEIVKELINESDRTTKIELEALMAGGSIEKPIHEEITYSDIHESKDNLWNFLFFTGYLKMCGQREEDDQSYVALEIPNAEIRSIYKKSIMHWFSKKVEHTDRNPLIQALEKGDCETVEKFISKILMSTISYYDYTESYYHGFLTGLFSNNEKYAVLSNRESGTGRPDLVLQGDEFAGKAIILELKISDKFTEMEQKCDEALAQIEEKDYAQPLINDGYQEILKYGVCFFKKGCRIKQG